MESEGSVVDLDPGWPWVRQMFFQSQGNVMLFLNCQGILQSFENG